MLFAFIAKLGVPQRLIGPLLGASAVLLLALCVWTWLRAHDGRVIEAHEAPIAAEVAAKTKAATDRANEADAERRANDARADEQLMEVIRDATEKHPAEVRHDAGPAVVGVLGKLRERQAPARPAPSK